MEVRGNCHEETKYVQKRKNVVEPVSRTNANILETKLGICKQDPYSDGFGKYQQEAQSLIALFKGQTLTTSHGDISLSFAAYSSTSP